jgi:hypothetical protein
MCVFVCMNVCVYVCMYVYMYVCMYVRACMYESMYVHTYVCVFIRMNLCMYMCVCMHCVCTYVCMYECMCVCIYVYFLSSVGRPSLYNPVIKPTWCTMFLSMFISFLYINSGDCVPIIRRNSCIYVTLGAEQQIPSVT